jgi:small subunit ribosomal protein S21
MREDYSDTKNGTKIYVKNNDIGRAMRKLKKMMQQEKVFQDIKDKEFFEKPSLKRKRAKASAVKRWKKYLAQRDKI